MYSTCTCACICTCTCTIESPHNNMLCFNILVYNRCTLFFLLLLFGYLSSCTSGYPIKKIRVRIHQSSCLRSLSLHIQL